MIKFMTNAAVMTRDKRTERENRLPRSIGTLQSGQTWPCHDVA
jgi:hypothetical protein